jgi:hypothetical protein
MLPPHHQQTVLAVPAGIVAGEGCRSSRIISARAVKRMIWVSRVPVHPDVKPIAAQLHLPFRRVVARLAQRL